MPKASKKTSIRKARHHKTVVPVRDLEHRERRNSVSSQVSQTSFTTPAIVASIGSEANQSAHSEDSQDEDEEDEGGTSDGEIGGDRAEEAEYFEDVEERADSATGNDISEQLITGGIYSQPSSRHVSEESDDEPAYRKLNDIDWGDDLNAPALLSTPSPPPQLPGGSRAQHSNVDRAPATVESIEDTLLMMRGVFQVMQAQQFEITDLQRWSDKIRKESTELQEMTKMEDAKGKRLFQWIMMYDAQDPDDAERHEGSQARRLKRRRKDGDLKEKDVGWTFEEMFGLQEEGKSFDANVKRRIGSATEGYEVDTFEEDAAIEPQPHMQRSEAM